MKRRAPCFSFHRFVFFLLGLALWLSPAHSQQSPSPPSPTAPAEERLATLEQRVLRLERQWGLRPAEGSPGGTLEERLERLESRVAELSARTQAANIPAPAPAAQEQLVSAPSPPPAENEAMTTPPYSGYMEMHLNQASGQPTILDFHRFVLLFGHSFSPRIKFWSEVEVEHALVEGGEESGELEIEQAFLDFFVKPEINFRAGILLAPIGILNERHEPPAFYGVERPFVDTLIIPTTWFDAGFGIYGDLGRGFTYKLYAMAPPDAAGFSAGEGIRGGRQSGLFSVVSDLGVTGRVEYRGVPRLTLGTSFFVANTGFRFQNLDPRLGLFEFDGRYRFRRFDFRGQFAQLWVSRTAELNRALLQQTGVNPNIAKSSLGYYLEAAYHLLPPGRVEADLAPFFRLERFNTQHRMAPGFQPLPQFDRTAYTLGISYRPHPDVALKLDYQFLRNRSDVIPIPNRFNLGIGWWF